MKQYLGILLLIFLAETLKSQKVLDEVTINSGRILIPFSEENRNLIIKNYSPYAEEPLIAFIN